MQKALSYRGVQRFVGRREVAEALGVSTKTVDRMVADGKFPRAVRLSPNRVGWAVETVRGHLQSRIEGVTRLAVSDPDKLAPEDIEPTMRELGARLVNPPDKALVLCVDEKTQVQALDRTQPGLPMKKGRAATMTHDYNRRGVTTLYAAMDVKSGLVIGDCQPRHRAKEFIAFLRKIDRCVQKALDVHVVLDNSSTHKTPEVKAWLTKHPRFKLHFTPTSASWLNLVERFFAEITRKRIRRGTFTSVADLEAAIEDNLLRHNADPKPFVWTKPAKVILEKERRALNLLDRIKTGH